MIVKELLVKLGFNVNTSAFDKFNAMANDVKSKMESMQDNFQKALSPEVKEKFEAIKNYADELKGLSKAEKDDIISLNKMEKQSIREISAAEKEKYKEFKSLEDASFRQKKHNAEQLKKLVDATRRISQVAAGISLAVTGGFLVGFRNMLKDAENFQTQKVGNLKTTSIFTSDQIKKVREFNRSIEAVKKNFNEIRNNIIVDLLPSFKEILNPIAKWIKENKELIKIKIKDFIATTIDIIKNLKSILEQLYSILKPIVSKMGGWKIIIQGIIGLTLASWAFRAATAIRGLSAAVLLLGQSFLWLPGVAFAKFIASGTVVSTSLTFLRVNLMKVRGALLLLSRGFLAVLIRTPIIAGIAAIAAVFATLAGEIYHTIRGENTFTNRFLKSEGWQSCKDSIDDIIEKFKILWEWLVKVKDITIDFANDSLKKAKNFFKDKIGLDFSINPFDPPKRISDFNLPRYDLEGLAGITNHDNSKKSVVVNHKSNINISVPAGTSQEQIFSIENKIKEALDKNNRFMTQQALAAIGAV